MLDKFYTWGKKKSFKKILTFQNSKIQSSLIYRQNRITNDRF